MTARRRAVLHIGVRKTGTTSVQRWLLAGAARHEARGVAVPLVGGANHSPLVRALRGDAAEDGAYPRRLDAALHALDPAIHTFVLTGELLSQANRQQALALKRFLDRHAASYRIVVYLRRQDELATSWYSTALKRGLAGRDPLGIPPVDYARILGIWSGVFGADAMRPRIFERDALAGGDVVADFVAAAGLDLDPPPERAAAFNLSLRPEAQALLARLAERGRAQGLAEAAFEALPGRLALCRALERHFAGRGALPSRAAAAAYLARCRAANEAVRARWFPERPSLFSEDLDRYPETPPPPADAETLLGVAMAALLGLIAEPPGQGAGRGGVTRSR